MRQTSKQNDWENTHEIQEEENIEKTWLWKENTELGQIEAEEQRTGDHDSAHGTQELLEGQIGQFRSGEVVVEREGTPERLRHQKKGVKGAEKDSE